MNYRKSFRENWRLVEHECFKIANENGFWNTNLNQDECMGLKISLMHSELSEALEAIRNGNPDSEKIKHFTELEEELADCVIRIMDFAHKFRLNVVGALTEKIDYNRCRPHKHGKKF